MISISISRDQVLQCVGEREGAAEEGDGGGAGWTRSSTQRHGYYKHLLVEVRREVELQAPQVGFVKACVGLRSGEVCVWWFLASCVSFVYVWCTCA